MQINFDDILTEWSYRLPKGFPTIMDGKFTERDEVIILNEILKERGLNGMELPEAKEKALKLDDSKIDKILSTPTLKSLTISKQLLKPKNILVLYAAGLAKASRADVLKNVAKDIKGKYVSQLSTAGAAQGTIQGIPFYVVLKPFVEEKTDTDMKEGMSVVLAQIPNIEPANDQNVQSIIASMIKATKGVEGLSESTKIKIVDYLSRLGTKAKENPKTRKIAATILNENVSQASSFQVFLKKNPNFRIERGQNKNELFTEIRNTAAQLTNLPADKWCPGDIYFVRKGSESKIRSVLQQALAAPTKEAGLTMVNGMFSPIPSFTSRVDAKHNIVAVSLKMSSAQGGKLKSAFQQYEGTPKDYNISPEEMKFNKTKLTMGIESMRAELIKAIKQERTTKYVYEPTNLADVKDPKHLLGKFGAYKSLMYILQKIAKKGDSLDDALVGLTAYGFGIVKKDNVPINPPFLKLIADAKGTATEPQYFEPGRTLMLMSLNGAPKPPQIEIVDGPKYGGIKVNLVLKVLGSGDETIKYEINFRYNGGSQLTIELGTPVHLH